MWRGAGGASGSAQQRIFWGLNQALGQAGYHCVLLDLGGSDGPERQTAEREAMHLRYALDSAFAGMIFYAYAYHDNSELIQEVAQRMPTVLIDRMVAGVDADFVGSQNRKAMFEATNYLIEQGHRRIAYLTRTEAINPVQDRLQGYLTAMHGAFGLNAQEIVLTAAPSDSHDWFVSDTIFRLPPEERPTAVLCVNDVEAMRLSERLEALGLSIPGDVSVIGFDNIIRALPDGLGLTTVAQSFEEIGKSAAKQFLRRVADPALPHTRIEIPTHLVIRESTLPIDVSH
ncbi:MAG: substrate-binding domain-containing protein [Capsulimonas sp.]|uniref:LacI family DNA-binding transcriptional regulator n=1 Tax=Capsulimonas sp. TaxID=2494211 RepID=UPI0032640CBC